MKTHFSQAGDVSCYPVFLLGLVISSPTMLQQGRKVPTLNTVFSCPAIQRESADNSNQCLAQSRTVGQRENSRRPTWSGLEPLAVSLNKVKRQRWREGPLKLGLHQDRVPVLTGVRSRGSCGLTGTSLPFPTLSEFDLEMSSWAL